ncbi:MAG: AAA family ATPase, partial [Bacteriovoracaceae bacterium]|nr:AAA family ATPase [Bacteriovoracaceae bacterium]
MQLVMIPRPRYLEMLRLLKDNRLIKIVTGVRRCGKSTIFQLFIEELKKQGVTEEQIQLIKLDEDEGDNLDLHNQHHLHQHIMQRIVPDKPNYIFLDEVQNVPEFEKAVRSLYEKSNIDLYLTGSNSRLQNGEWATALSGRCCEIKMYPL